jgi:hypothetical protein
MISLLFTLFLVEDGEERKGVMAYQAIQESRLLLALDAAEETDDGDDAVDGDGFEGLGLRKVPELVMEDLARNGKTRQDTHHGVGAANFKNVLHTTAAGGKLLRLLAPVLNLLVINHMIGSQGLELVALGSRRSRSNNLRARSLRELHSKHAHTSGSLSKNPVTGLQAPALQSVKTVPRSKTRADKSAALQEVEVGRHGDEALLVESAVLLESAINGAANAGLDGDVVERAREVALVEEGEDFVALLEAGHAGADGFDHTGAVGGGDDGGLQGEGVEAFDDGQVAVVERGGLDWVVLVAESLGGVSDCLLKRTYT